jgi:hypothetical protein
MRETLLDHLRDHPLPLQFTPDALNEGAASVAQNRVARPQIGERRAAAYVADDRLGGCRAEL